MKTNILKTLLFSGLMGLAMPIAHADTFGSGANAFTIDFVEIGDPGNPNDSGTTGSYHTDHGGVANTFRMGTYAVSDDMIQKANTLGSLGIFTMFQGPDQPARRVSWNEAARFVNWLNTSNGHSAAYKFALQPGDSGYSVNANIELWTTGDAGYDASNPYRNANAHYFLPSEDEWYKAAYYSGSGSTYFDYALGSDTIPTATSGGTAAGTAVFSGQIEPADIDNAGGLSFYGTMGQNGNVWEWNESAFDGVNNSTNENRGIRGGFWRLSEDFLRSSFRSDVVPTGGSNAIGFRVASVPEPSTIVMLLVGVLILKLRKRFSL